MLMGTLTCEECTMFVFLPGNKRDYTCQKWKLIGLLEKKVQSLQEWITTLCEIKKGKEFIDRRFDVLYREDKISQRDNSVVH